MHTEGSLYNLLIILLFLFSTPGYAMVSAAHPDLQVLVSLSCVFGLSSLCFSAEVAVISLLASAS